MSSQIQENVHIAEQLSAELASAQMPHDNTDETTQLLGATSASKSKSDASVNYQSISEELSSSGGGLAADNGDDHDDHDDEEAEDGIKLKKEYQNLPWSKRPSVPFITIIMLSLILVSMASGSTMLDVIVFLVCKDHYKALGQVTPSNSTLLAVMENANDVPVSITDPRCFAPEIMATVGMLQTYVATISAILSMFTLPLWASYSDRVGRKPLLLLGLVSIMISDLIDNLCFFLPDVFNYRWIIVSGFVDGICGSTSILFIVCSSYISDAIKETYRANVISVFDAWASAGMAVGPLIGSFILKITNRNLAVLFSSVLFMDVFRVLIVLLFLQESRSEYSRRKSMGTHLARQQSYLDEQRLRRASTATSASSFNDSDSASWRIKGGLIDKIHDLLQRSNILEPLKVLKFSNLPDKRARTNVYLLIIVQATIGEVISASITFMILYAKSQFNFTSIENNYFMSLLGSSKFVVLSLVFPQVLKAARARWPHSPTRIDFIDKRIVQVGLICSTTGLFVMAEAPTGVIYLSSVIIMSLGSGTSPIVSNAIIKHAPKNKVGEVLGAASVLAKIQGIVTPVIFATIYNCTIKSRSQAIIEMVCAIEFLMFLCMSCLYVQTQIPSIDDIESTVQE